MTTPDFYRLVDWFIPEHWTREPVLHERARMFVINHLTGPFFGVSVLYYLFYVLDRSPGMHRTILMVAVAGFLIHPFLLRLTGRLVLLALISTEQLILLVLFLSYHYGGPSSPFMAWILVVPLLVLFYVGPSLWLRVGVMLALAVQVIIPYLFYLQGNPTPEHVAVDTLVGAATISVLCAGGYMAVTSLFFAKILMLQQGQLRHEIASHRETEVQLHHSQRLEALGTLAGGVAHELNNSLVPVLALSKMVTRKLPEGSRERANLTLVTQGAERARDLVKQILAFSRKEEVRREVVDVAAVLREALMMLRASLPATIRFDQTITATPLLDGDPVQLHQVIVNLLTNAAQAIGPVPGVISVGLHASAVGARFRLTIADTGIGMDDATKARIFEPFFTTKEVGQGSGLGLSVVHGIVTSHGGSIEVTSKPGHGTCLDVVLPAKIADANAA